MNCKKVLSVVTCAAVCAFSGLTYAGGPFHAAPSAMGSFYGTVSAGTFEGKHQYTLDTYTSGALVGAEQVHGLQNSLTIGGSVGYGITTVDNLYIGIDLGAQITPGTAVLNSDHVQIDSHLKNQYNLTVQPGVMINAATLLYATFGASYAQMDLRLTHSVLNQSDTPLVWGFVFGGGLRYYLTPGIAVFGAWNHFNYAKLALSSFEVSGTKGEEMAPNLHVTGSSYKVGVLYNFF